MLKKVKIAKRALCLMLSFMLVAAVTAVVASADDAVAYGSLIDPEIAACESQTAIDSFGKGVGAQPRVIDNSEFHSGTGSVKVTVSSANVSYVAFTPTENIVEDALYRFSVWYKDSRETPSGRLQLRARTTKPTYILTDKDAEYLNSGYKNILSGWQKYEVLFYGTSAMASSDFQYFYLTSDTADARTMNFDDIVFERVSPYEEMLSSTLSECEDSNYSINNKHLSVGGTVYDPGKAKAIVTTEKHSGEGSLAITSTTDTYLALFTFKPKEEIVTGDLYNFSFWYKDPDGKAGNNIFELVARSTGNSGSSALISQKLISGSEWHKYSGYFTVPSTHTGSNFAFFYLRASGFSEGTIYFDDLSLRKVDTNAFYYGNGLIDSGIAVCDDMFALDSFTTNNLNYAGTRSLSTVYAHSGVGSVAITTPGNYQTCIGVKPIEPLVEGQQYCFSIWYYNPGNLSGNLYLRYVSGNNTTPNWIGSGVTTSNVTKKALGKSGWQKYDYTFTATGASMTTNLTYLYVTTDASATGTLYFDDISLVKVPSTTTVCTSSNLGNVVLGEPMKIVFSDKMDTANLPSSAVVDGDTVVDIITDVTGKTASVVIGSPLDEGAHTMTATFKDYWGRDVSANVSFTAAYGNLVDSALAACESDYALNIVNSKYKVYDVPRALDYENAHSGAGSIKVTTSSTNFSYITFKPLAKLVSGQKYYFSVWYYDTNEAESGKFILRGRSTTNGAITIPNLSEKQVEIGGWKKYEATFVANDALQNTLNFMYFTIGGSATDSRDIYFDDMFMCKVEPQVITADVYDSEDNAVSAWTQGDLTAKVNLTNNSLVGDKFGGIILFANYSGTGANKKLVNIAMQRFNETVEASTTVTKEVPLSVSEGNELKVFVFETFSKSNPLIPVVTK